MWSWGRRSCSQWHVRRGGRPDAAMGMTSALAAAGTGRREGGGGDGDGSCTGGGWTRPKRKGVRAGRAEAAAMEEQHAVWIRRPRALERRCEMDYRRASKGPRGTGHCISVENARGCGWKNRTTQGTDRHCRTVTADKLKI